MSFWASAAVGALEIRLHVDLGEWRRPRFVRDEWAKWYWRGWWFDLGPLHVAFEDHETEWDHIRGK